MRLDVAYVLRASVYGLFVDIASAVHGLEHAESITDLVWAHYGENFEEYKRGIKNA
jgi:hypothetical protein